MGFIIEILKVIFLGIVQGITEWLPISSTGHMILVDQFMKIKMTPDAMKLMLVVIQLGSILAVILIYFKKIWPFEKNGDQVKISKPVMVLWSKILVASIPAAVVGILWDDVFDRLFYNSTVVAIMLILFGIFFILVENYNKGKEPKVRKLGEITYQMAFVIGIFQMIAAIFPGTSRSGATIIGALLLGISRYVAAEFTFFLAIPAMAGASLLKLIKLGVAFPLGDWVLIFTGTFVAFVVSVFAIKFLMSYIKRHDFKVFGWYRIGLGVLVLLYFLFA